MIRAASKNDITNLVLSGEKFFNESGYESMANYNHESITDIMISMIDQQTLLTDGNGSMIGFYVFPMFMDKFTLVAQELFWYVPKESRGTNVGVSLLQEAERIASEKGAKFMLCVDGVNQDEISSLYKKMGYSPKERVYAKGL